MYLAVFNAAFLQAMFPYRLVERVFVAIKSSFFGQFDIFAALINLFFSSFAVSIMKDFLISVRQVS